jgi:hypothetical protein
MFCLLNSAEYNLRQVEVPDFQPISMLRIYHRVVVIHLVHTQDQAPSSILWEQTFKEERYLFKFFTYKVPKTK